MIQELHIRLLILSFFIFSYSYRTYAYFIDYIKFQHAGEIGYISAGLGHNVTKNYSIEYFHGFVPEDIGGSEIETFAIKNNYTFYELESYGLYSELYVGVNIYHVTGLDYQSSRHPSYPEEYYRMGSIRGLLYTGFKIHASKFKNHFGYFESGLNDIVLINYYNNPDVIDLSDFVSLAIGYGYLF